MYDTKEIKNRMSCVDVAQLCGLPIRKAGDRCISPLRPGATNKTSFLVDDDFWYDFGGGRGGDCIDLLAEVKYNGDRGAAIRHLAESTGVEDLSDRKSEEWKEYTNKLNARAAYYNSKLTDSDREYLHNRGIKDSDIQRLLIGRVTDGALKGRLFLPYFKSGYVCYYATRAMEGSAFPENKYMKQKKDEYCQHVPWGMQTLDRDGDTLVIAEGYFDAASFEVCGYPVLSAITGRFSKDQIDTVVSIAKSYRRVFIVYDNDNVTKAGESFTHDMAEILSKNSIPFIVGTVPQPYHDISDYYAAGGNLETIIDSAMPDEDFLKKSIFDLLGAPEMFTGPWTVDKDGVTCDVVINKKTGEKDTVRVTSTPIIPQKLLVNADTGIHKMELCFRIGKMRKTIIQDCEVIANKNKIVSLANMGVDVTTASATQLVNYIADMKRFNMDKIPHAVSVSHLGWVGDKFLPYDEGIQFDGETTDRKLFNSISAKGSAEDWCEYMLHLRKNKALRMTMAASFASPLIEKCGALPFVFHLWGTTGGGKTVALKVAMSIWGKPELGDLIYTMNMTDNAMMNTAGFLYSLPFAGDELQLVKSQFGYDRLIMRVTEGIDRGRMKYDTKVSQKVWKNAFIFTGEEPCTSDNSGGGTKNRVVEVNADDGVVENGRETAWFVGENYGHAGKTFIDYAKTQDVKARYNEIYETVSGVTDKQAMAATMVLLGDALAVECLFPSENPLEWKDISEWFRDAEEVSISERAETYICGWLVQNQNKFDPFSGNEIYGVRDGRSYYVLTHVLKKALEDQKYSFDAVKKDWSESGFLVKNKNNNRFTKRKGINGGLPYCYELYVDNVDKM